MSKSGPLNYWQSDTTLDETVNAAELVVGSLVIRLTKAISPSIVENKSPKPGNTGKYQVSVGLLMHL